MKDSRWRFPQSLDLGKLRIFKAHVWVKTIEQSAVTSEYLRAVLKNHEPQLSALLNLFKLRSFGARISALSFRGLRIHWGGRRRQAATDQRPELHPLQDLWHQRSDPKYQLGHSSGRRRSGLQRHVMWNSQQNWPIEPFNLLLSHLPSDYSEKQSACSYDGDGWNCWE